MLKASKNVRYAGFYSAQHLLLFWYICFSTDSQNTPADYTKMKFSIPDFFRMVNVTKSADMKKSLLDNFIFCAVPVIKVNGGFCDITCHIYMAIFLLSSVSVKLTMSLTISSAWLENTSRTSVFLLRKDFRFLFFYIDFVFNKLLYFKNFSG